MVEITVIKDVEKLKQRLRESNKEERERNRQVEARRHAERDEYEQWKRQQELLNRDSYIGPSTGDNLNEPDDDDIKETPFFKNLLRNIEDGDLEESEPEDYESDDGDLEESEPEDGDLDDDAPVDECFTMEDIKLLADIGQLSPAQITAADKNDQIKHAEEMIKKIGGLKGQHVKNGNTKAVENADYLLNLLRVYLDTIKTGGGNKRFRRIPYKIGTGGRYGNLVIHMPRLLTFGDLKACRGGKLVLRKDADMDTIDLLTKKYNPGRNYSNTAKKLFQTLTQLSGLSDNVLSRKYQLV